MSHKTFKVCILIDSLVENFYIKHYIDEFNPVFNRFKTQVFQRNPSVNVPNLKIYWIDGENDEILLACEEDFRLFLEEGKGKKIFFSVTSQNEPSVAAEPQPMEAEDIPQATKCERRSRKGRDEEKHMRHARKLAEKLKHLEETCLKKEDKGRRYLEKRESKHTEKLEKAKRRVEQIRSLIGSIDPANLNSSTSSNEQQPQQSKEEEVNVGASTSTENPSADVHPSPETIRLLSNAIAGCLQPCSLINKILNEVIAMIPQMVDPMVPPPPYAETQTDVSMEQRTQATNTSNVGTPVQQASNEIEALFKEAAKELEKMNEIVNSSKIMETSATSSSGNTAITQIEQTFNNINDSAISNATIVNMNEQQEALNQLDEADAPKPMAEEEFKIVTPRRSRESSIEVHDVNSLMSDDSRDWTILSATDDISVEPSSSRANNPDTGAIPKKTSVDNFSQVDFTPKSTSETQTPTLSLLNDSLKQQELQASVQKSIDIVQKSIATIQKSIVTAQEKSIQVEVEPKLDGDSPPSIEGAAALKPKDLSIPVEIPKVEKSIQAPLYGVVSAEQAPTAPQSRANWMAQGHQQPFVAEQKQAAQKFEPAVIVYDPNPKINSAVHTMINMGYTNEDNWLTQLMVNVDGDIPKALNFLTPQPKNTKKH